MNVLVTGMHRSGTSAIANVLRSAGLFGWDDEDAMAASPENPDGYGERRDVMELNEQLLGELGWGWDSPPAEPWAQPPALDLLVDQGRRLVRNRLDDREPWFIKDPRISLLLPWWRRILLDRFCVVVAVRDPSEVAWSLSVRNAFPPSLGLALWDAYHRHLWAGLHGLSVTAVSYDALVTDPKSTVADLFTALRTFGVSEDLDEEAAVGVIRPSLRRATQPRDATDDKGWWPTASWEVVRATAGAVIESFAMDYPPADPTEIALLDLKARTRGIDVVAQQNTLGDAVEQLRAELFQARQEYQAENAALAAQITELQRRQSVADASFVPRASQLVERGRARLWNRSRELLGKPDAAALLVDRVWYAMTYPDVAEAGTDPADHYRQFGATELRNPNALFDTAWYLETYPDVADAGINPLEHYHSVGWKEHRDPSSIFDTSWYLETNPDVAQTDVDPLLHYLRYGAQEWRLPSADYNGLPVLSPGLARTPDGNSLPTRALRRLRRSTDGAAGRSRYPWTEAELDALIPDGERAAVLHALGDYVASLPRARYVPFVPPTARVLYYDNATSAIARLESLRAEGIGYLVATAASMALMHRFATHLDRYDLAHGAERFSVYSLQRKSDSTADATADATESLRACLDRAVRHVRAERDREPAVLDLRPDPSPAIHGAFRPPEPRHLENYVAGTVDVVVAPSEGDERSQAERIARSAVVLSDAKGRDARATFLETDTERLPGVSIVIPTYEHEELVRTCVRAIGETVPAELDVEVIVVDDASSAPISQAPLEALAAGHRVRVVRNQTNLGFVGSINRGAAAARKEILFFLNNDTIPLTGWLEPVLTLFRARPDAGIVGSKLVYPDGRLQEAGGIVFSDASAANFGRGDPNVESDSYSYVRQVDYVSGAALATPRTLFESVGGLATVYGFGYYDDADYAFTLRRHGRVTLLQPRSVVVHLEGSSAGTDTGSGAKRYQVTNRKIFAERWAAELAFQANPPERWRTDGVVRNRSIEPAAGTRAAA